MSIFIIGNYVTFTDTANGKTRYQNFFSEGEATLAGEKYQLLPFNYQGAQKTKSGDNISSQLTLPANPITLNWVQSAVNNGWQVNVKTYQLNDITYTPDLLLSDETWIATGLTYNTQAVEMELSSAIDAIGAQAPNLRISREAVGALPSTGAIRSG
jgi:hypothetical protein